MDSRRNKPVVFPQSSRSLLPFRGSRHFCVAPLVFGTGMALAPVSEFQPDPAAGPGQVRPLQVRRADFGFDIERNGSEGLLSASQLMSGGNYLAASETFSRKTGRSSRWRLKTNPR